MSRVACHAGHGPAPTVSRPLTFVVRVVVGRDPLALPVGADSDNLESGKGGG